MSGDIKPVPPARCLDLSRLISRVGRGPATGIDRVELAYLQALCGGDVALFALVRTGLGYFLLDHAGAGKLLDRLLGKVPWGPPDVLSRLFLKASDEKRAAISDLRRLCLARSGKGGLAAMLSRHLPSGVVYLNVGHSNLERHVFETFHNTCNGRVSVLIHDMIPLDFPEYQRPGTVEAFEARLRRVGELADLVIYNSDQSRADGERYFSEWGRVPDAIVAHLGVDIAPPDPAQLPTGLDLSRPYFVSVGTIEPRKNHALLLDIWDHFSKEHAPEAVANLFIVGNRGWNNEEVFRRLDDPTLSQRHVFELTGLSDGAMSALVGRAQAMLFPSFAEGYGLPPCEAIAQGVPVVANDLPVYREMLGNIPVYANVRDMYSWAKIIRQLAEQNEAEKLARNGSLGAHVLANWQDHFRLVLQVT